MVEVLLVERKYEGTAVPLMKKKGQEEGTSTQKNDRTVI